MSERDEAGLRRLKQDLDEADWPAPELLARYATEPNRLSETEKLAVERALASSPLVADELATLRGFDFARLDADRREAPAVLAGAPGSILYRLFAALRHPPVFVAITAAVALFLWLSRSDTERAGPASPPTLAERRAPGPDRIDGAAPEIEQDEVGGDRVGGSAGESTGTIADASPSPPAADPSSAPPRGPEEASPSSPSASGGAQGRLVAEQAGSGRASGGASSKPDARAGDEILLALATPDYRPAYGRDVVEGGEWIVRGGDAPSIRITALVPDHVVRACSASPILLWHVDRLPEAGDFRLSIADENDRTIVDDRTLPRPSRAGLQRIDLAALGIALPADRTLRWSIALRSDDGSPPAGFDFGWLRVEPPAAADAANLAAGSEGDRAAAFATLGCYSEAVEAVLDVRQRQPHNVSASAALARLAQQGGLPEALFRD